MTILRNGICTNQNPSKKMRPGEFFFDFEKQIDHLILARIQDIELINKIRPIVSNIRQMYERQKKNRWWPCPKPNKD